MKTIGLLFHYFYVVGGLAFVLFLDHSAYHHLLIENFDSFKAEIFISMLILGILTIDIAFGWEID